MKRNKESAVSSVVSEMLLIGIVLVIIPGVTISFLNHLPESRIPTVTIIMSDFQDNGSIFLYHKGGDWIKTGDFKIMCNSKPAHYEYRNQLFDLGNFIQVKNVAINDKITFVAKNSVIFSGIIK